MYIASMTIKNLRNVEFLDVHFSKLMNKISWKNWAWKSTLIDAIRFWILWKTYMWTWTSSELYITQGKEECEINIKIADEDRTIHVRRKVTKAWNVYLEAVDSNADKLWQKELSALLYTICIDPLEFTRKNTKEQFELVKQITWCDTSEIDEEIEELKYKDKLTKAAERAHKIEQKLNKTSLVDKVEQVKAQQANEMKDAQEFVAKFQQTINELPWQAETKAAIQEEFQTGKFKQKLKTIFQSPKDLADLVAFVQHYGSNGFNLTAYQKAAFSPTVKKVRDTYKNY